MHNFLNLESNEENARKKFLSNNLNRTLNTINFTVIYTTRKKRRPSASISRRFLRGRHV